jgi:hypothetical protein
MLQCSIYLKSLSTLEDDGSTLTPKRRIGLLSYVDVDERGILNVI